MCPLCQENEIQVFHSHYFRCSNCAFIFLDPNKRVDIQEEKRQYDLHENNPQDLGYRNFLSQIINPLKQYLPRDKKLKGLDYGSGPGPTLNLMLEEEGIEMRLYDPFYHPHEENLKRKYDVITCTEVAEHFFNPYIEFKKLKGLLKNGGVLAIMTDLYTEDMDFKNWHYIKDPTHVGFFSPYSLNWLAENLDLKVEIFGKRVAILSF
jgi:SAM-dependent methyltransferase